MRTLKKMHSSLGSLLKRTWNVPELKIQLNSYIACSIFKMADGDEIKPSCCGGNIDTSEDLIRQGYKYYKRKKPPPDFSEVLDFNNPETFHGRVSEIPLRKFLHADHGLRCTREWKVYQLLSCPGFIFIVNPFINGAQNYWTKRCIEDFTRKPNVSNLDAHMKIEDDDSVWEMSR